MKLYRYLTESTGEYCHFYRAKDRKWYYVLGATHYGPFTSEEEAEEYLKNNHANPGGWSTDKSASKVAPKHPVKN